MPPDVLRVVISSLSFDIGLFLRAFTLSLPVFWVLDSWIRGKKIVIGGCCAIGSIFLVFYLGLLAYFSVAGAPLGSDLYAYNFKGILQTASGGLGNKSFLYMVAISATILAFPVLLWFTTSKIEVYLFDTRLVVFAFIIGVLLWIGAPMQPDSRDFDSEYSYGLAMIKGAYFVTDSLEYYLKKFSKKPTACGLEELERQVLISRSEKFDGANPDFVYTDTNYSFLRKNRTTNELEQFFQLPSDTPVNLFIIQVEGLIKKTLNRTIIET